MALKQLDLNPAVVISVAVIGAICAAAGAYVGYGQGYKKGNFVGSHEVSRSASAGTTEMLTRGFAIKQADGTSKSYVLQPVEAAKN